MRTRSASDSACILRITRPRWVFTVISRVPSSAATCLFSNPLHDQAHHFALTWGQLLVTGTYLGQLRALGERLPISGQGLLDGSQQLLIVEWLGEKFHGACLHGSHRGGNIALAGNKNDGKGTVRRGQLALEINPAQSGQTHVEHQARRLGRRFPSEKFGSRSKSFNPQTDRANKAG